MAEPPGSELLARAQAGDDTAFEALIATWRPELWAYFLRATGSTEAARDLLQETLLLAWRGLGGFRGEAQLRTWLFRIARNRLVSVRRRQQGPSPLSLDALAEEALGGHEPEDERPDLAEIFARSEFAQFLIGEARRCCEPNEFLALMLAYRGLEVREIAALLRLGENHVRVLTFRARGKLLSHLFLNYPDALGGRGALEAALAQADLSEAERALFRQAILDGRPPRRSLERLRAVCLKVARHLRGV